MGRNPLIQWWRDESGATAMEYALIAALIAVVVMVGLTSFSDALLGIYTTNDDSLKNTIDGAGS